MIVSQNSLLFLQLFDEFFNFLPLQLINGIRDFILNWLTKFEIFFWTWDLTKLNFFPWPIDENFLWLIDEFSDFLCDLLTKLMIFFCNSLTKLGNLFSNHSTKLQIPFLWLVIFFLQRLTIFRNLFCNRLAKLNFLRINWRIDFVKFGQKLICRRIACPYLVSPAKNISD